MPREVESPAEWMRYAKSDLALAKAAASDGVMFETLCFHVQQAVEKSLKAVLVAKAIPFPQTHNIDSLIGLLPSDVPLPPEDANVAELTESVVKWAEDILAV